jgi:hypothetical protein
LKDITNYVSLLGKGESNKRLETLRDLLRGLYTDSRVSLVASLPIDSIDLRDQYAEISNYIEAVFSAGFLGTVNLGPISARERQKIFSHYELCLDEKREVELGGVEDILNVTEGFSNSKYLLYLLKYMKSSLLSHGKIIPVEAYDQIVKAIKK